MARERRRQARQSFAPQKSGQALDWTKSNKPLYRQERKYLRQMMPGSSFKFEPDGKGNRNWVVEGEFYFRARYPEDGQIIEDQYLLRITYYPNHPERLPSVKELGGKIHGVDEHDHFLSGGDLCLEVEPQKYIIFNENGADAGAFFDHLLVPYLYRNSYLRKFKKEPFRGRPRGNPGLEEWMREFFETDNIRAAVKILGYIYIQGYHRQNICPCGSGKKVRNCHKVKIKAVQDLVPRAVIGNFLIIYLKSIEKSELASNSR